MPAKAASVSSQARSSRSRSPVNCSGHSPIAARAVCNASSGAPIAFITEPKAGGCRFRWKKASASSALSSGGSTATMSSTTASLIVVSLLQFGLSVQLRRLQELETIGRGHRDVEGDAFMMYRQRHVDAGSAEAPQLLVEAGLARDLLAVDREDDVAGLELGTGGRAVGGDPDHNHAVVDLGRKESEPRPCRLVDAAEPAQIVQDRFQQVDRHDHVDVLGLAVALAFELQRADADQLATLVEERRATPIRVRGMGEDRLVQEIFPVAGEFLLGHDLARDRTRASAAAADHDAVAESGLGRNAERQRVDAEPAERLHQAKAGDGIEAEHMSLHHPPVSDM